MILKKSILIMFFFVMIGCSENKPEKQIAKISLSNLRKIDVRDYYGITVDSFMHNLDFSYKSYYWLSEPPGYLSTCCFVYNDSVKIYITVDSVKYQERFSPTLTWNIDKFIKEKILSIGIHIHGKPIHYGYFLGPPPKNYSSKPTNK